MQIPWKACLFDLDGTLVETAPEIADAVNDTLRYFDWPPVSQQLVDRWIGHGTMELLVKALAHVTGKPVADARSGAHLGDVAPIFDRYYQLRCGSRSTLYPQVREVLQALRAAGCKLAVVTNKEGRYTDTVLKAHGLQDMFDAVISGDSFAVKKPDPAGVLDCLRRWGLTPGEALFVGDSSIDAATARNAGMPVYLLPYGYNMGQDVHDCAPDRVIGDLSWLLRPDDPAGAAGRTPGEGANVRIT